MRLLLIALFVAAVCVIDVTAQEAGNRGYQRERANQGYGNTSQPGRPYLEGDLLLYDPKDVTVAPYVEATVLMNVKPDAFVAVFAIAQEGKTADESNAKVDRLAGQLIASTGAPRESTFVDFITQNPVYDYSVSGRTAREALTGFQTKKTVSVRYTDRAQLERMVAAAAQLGVYDLVKVDYVVTDMAAVRDRLFEEASRIVKKKEANYARLLGVTLKSKAVSEERYIAYAPQDLYKTYTAYEAGSVETSSSTTRVVDRRKSSTSYYDPLTSANYDMVINPAGVEPVVQCTLFLKVRCEWGTPAQ